MLTRRHCRLHSFFMSALGRGDIVIGMGTYRSVDTSRASPARAVWARRLRRASVMFATAAMLAGAGEVVWGMPAVWAGEAWHVLRLRGG